MNLEGGERLEQGLTQAYQSLKAYGKMLALSAKGLKLPRAEGEELFVLASGPSTKDFLEKHQYSLKAKTLMVLNHFPDTPAFQELKPRYLLGMNRAFWTEEKESGAADKIQKTYQHLEQNTDWPLTFFLPAKARKTVKKGFFQNQQIAHAYWNKNGMEGRDSWIFPLFRKNLGAPRCWNSAIAALYCGLTMGYNRVYLIGADHNWSQELVVDGNNQTLLRKVHFYESKEEVKLEPFVHSETGRALTVAELMKSWSVVFETYRLLARYAEHFGAEIINLNPDSFIDAFKKQAYEDL